MAKYRKRRIGMVFSLIAALVAWLGLTGNLAWLTYEVNLFPAESQEEQVEQPTSELAALNVLAKLEVKGRAPKNTYKRTEFYDTWPSIGGCSLRQRIIKRELGESAQIGSDKCSVTSGTYIEPYTGNEMIFTEKSEFSSKIQIDHVVALSDAWQKGADNSHMDKGTRYQLATDPLNLLAVDGPANQQKSDSDAASWLPTNKAFRCQYVARQISVKYKYKLWVTQAEHDAMADVLKTCPNEPVVGIEISE